MAVNITVHLPSGKGKNKDDKTHHKEVKFGYCLPSSSSICYCQTGKALYPYHTL